MKIKDKIFFKNTLLIFSLLLFIGCVGFLIYYLGIQPYRSRQVQNKYKEIYYSSSEQSENVSNSHNDTSSNSFSNNFSDDSTELTTHESETTFPITLDTSVEKGKKNSKGILVKFEALRKYNKDVKGWLNIPGTCIDYPVLQNSKDPDYYLTRDFEGNTDKNGSLYLDSYCSVKTPSKNLVIHGHNMESTRMMFYELVRYKDIDYYREHPVITFDSIYEESQWKIIGFMRVSGNFSSKGSFNYIQGSFESDEAFLDFVYQIQLRSSYYCPVDVNEDDSLLMLSTCTYEIDDYRAVVVARKIRPNESNEVNTDAAYERKEVLYPDKWYTQYDGEPPLITSFTDAMSFGEINWYDGDIEINEAVGSTIEYEDAKYEITSASTLKYLKPANKKVTEVTIPSDIELNGRAFEVTEIATDAFAKAKKLMSVKIGNKIKKIPAKAFNNCKKLKTVVVGEAVEKIGNKAFYNLNDLKNIKIYSTKLTLVGEKAFKHISEKATIKLLKKNFKHYREMLQESGLSENVRFVKLEID